MTLPAFNFAQPIVDANGYASKALQVWMKAVATAVNATAGVYVPTTRRVVGSGGIKGGGPLSDDVGLVWYRMVGAVSALPTTGNAIGDFAYALNGRKPGEGAGAGTGVPVWWNGAAWFAVTSGAAVTA